MPQAQLLLFTHGAHLIKTVLSLMKAPCAGDHHAHILVLKPVSQRCVLLLLCEGKDEGRHFDDVPAVPVGTQQRIPQCYGSVGASSCRCRNRDEKKSKDERE